MNTKPDYRRALGAGFAAMDRNTDSRGFWSPVELTYARARLGVTGDTGVVSPDFRYTPFGLAGALRAHRISGLGDREHLTLAAQWVRARWAVRTDPADLFYGGLWCLVEAAITFADERFITTAAELSARFGERFLNDPDLDAGVALFALAEAVSRGMGPTAWRRLVSDKATALARSVNQRGVPATGDPRAPYHQRMMYSCWGLANAGLALSNPLLTDASRRILRFVTQERFDADSGIRWHGLIEPNATPRGLPRVYPWGSHIYYECHQCFFVIAVELLRNIDGDRDLMDASCRALEWVFGRNRWQVDLSGVGVPGLAARCISRSGKLELLRNRFKGFYEVGSYLWALSLAAGETL